MARYWIRNRGRVQGPFSEERIQGLLRRGRFSRHFHVSEDRKTWFPASEYPELFAGVGGPEPANEESPFSSGGSPFDDGDDEHDAPPARVPTSERKRGSSSRRAAVEDDDDDEDDEDEEWEDDDEWEDDSDGVLSGFVRWIERNVKALVAVLVLALLGLSWFVFMREDFTQDIEDKNALQTVQTKMTQAHETGVRADEWIVMLEAVEKDLSPMVTRLEDNATAMDMVKQELLFLARDDIPRMFKELPQGRDEAANRVRIRFSLIDQMIESKTRFHDGTALMAPLPIPAPPQQPPGTQNQPDGQAPPGNSDPSGGQGNLPADNPQPSGPGNQAPNTFTPATTSQGTPGQ